MIVPPFGFVLPFYITFQVRAKVDLIWDDAKPERWFRERLRNLDGQSASAPDLIYSQSHRPREVRGQRRVRNLPSKAESNLLA